MSSHHSHGKLRYYRYYLSIHYGIAQKFDKITQIILNDRVILEGEITQSQVFNINKENLFGGPKYEGGIQGGITILMGEDHQFMPPYLLAKFIGIENLIPSYRGITTLFFHQLVKKEYDGALLGDLYEIEQNLIFLNDNPFYFQANNPYLRDLKVIGSRQPKGLTKKYSAINRDNRVSDANPAHIIYELMTNRDFGANLPISRIDVESFELAAQTLFNEGFGISLKWINQGKVKDLILEVLDHINAFLYEDPHTGLSVLKLLRDDYIEDNLPVANYSNCTITNFQRKQKELVNEITVTYTNRVTYDEETVTVQDLAGIATEGGVISTSRNYYGVHKSDLAKSLGERDLRAEGYPLITAEIQFFREFWNIVPGMVLKLDSIDDSDEIIIVRVIKINDDTTGTGPINATVVQDVFSLLHPTEFATSKSIIEYKTEKIDKADNIQAFTMPYTISVQKGLIEPISNNYPTAHIAILASASQSNVNFYEIAGEQKGLFGASKFQVISTGTIIPRGILNKNLPGSVFSTIDIPMLTNGNQPDIESFAVIGTGNDNDLEIAGVTRIDNNTKTLTLQRGILDTVPKFWAAGTPIWFLNISAEFWDETDRSAMENVEFKVLPIGFNDRLAIDDAVLHDFYLTERSYAPFRPANVQIEGTGFGTYTTFDKANQKITWANRYRPGEDAIILKWDDASVVPEKGQTTEIDVLHATDRTVLNSYTGITGTSYTLPETAWAGEQDIIVKVYSSRNDIRSIQGHEINVTLLSGYGLNYGTSWGD